MTGIDALGGLGFAAAMLGAAAYRFHKHDKLKHGRMFMFLAASVFITFTAAFWMPGLFRFTSNGIGLFIVGGAFGWTAVDFAMQVILKHNQWHAKRTAYAAFVLGISGVLIFANLTQIKASLHNDFGGGGGSQVMSKVQQDGQG